MLPVNTGGHASYQNFVTENLRKYYPNPDALSRSVWDIIERFWNLDLSYTDEFMRSRYSVFGSKPRTPSCMQRSYLLSIDFKVNSLTDWAAQLKINPLYAILSGFEFGDTPGVGTFYAFLNRRWDSHSNNLSPHEHPVKMKLLPQLESENVKNVSARVKKMALLTANAAFIFLNLIVISAGILPVTVFITDTICICLLTPKAIFQYFLIIPAHQNMIRHEAAKNGKRNIMPELQLNVPINVKK